MRAALTTAFVGALFAVPADAGAVGQLNYGGCLSADGSGGLCGIAAAPAVRNPTSIAISPDGRSIYLAGFSDNAVGVFDRAAGGQVTYTGCVSNSGSAGLCADLPDGILVGSYTVAVSPDGGNLYVVSHDGGAVVVFNRAPGGQLTYAGCVSDDGSAGLCADVPAPLDKPWRMAISPDGRSLYVTVTDGVVVFDRAPAGQITYAACASETGSAGRCADVPGTALHSANAVTVAPDGANVYVTGFQTDAVTVFNRADEGRLTYAGCVSDSGSAGFCADVPGTPLATPDALALSPDGRTLYVAGASAHGVTVFDRAPAGQLTYAGCVSDSGSAGLCADVPGKPIGSADGVAVSGDGESVYVAGADGALSVFDRAPAGGLTYAGCVSDDGSATFCADLPGAPLLGLGAVAVSPDGRSVYGAASGTGTLVHLFRKTRPETTIVAGPAEGATVAERSPAFAFAADQSPADFECALDGGAFAACASPFRPAPLADGDHVLAVRAVSGGDVDLRPAPRSSRIAVPADPAAPADPGTAAPGGTVTGFRDRGPAVRILKGPRGRLKAAKRRLVVRFSFAADQPGARFRCALDRRPTVPCPGDVSFRVGRGPHRLTVSAVDPAGNEGAPVTRSFRVVRTTARQTTKQSPRR